MATVTERERASILSSLAAGVVPAIGLHHTQVGRKAEVDAFLGDLQRIASGGAGVRFIVGRFGSGKSFFLNLLKTVALERRFVVARADITLERRLQGTGGQSRGLYAELMKNVATRSKAEGGALASVVERWVSDVAHEVSAAGGNDEAVRKAIMDRCKPLQDLVSGYDFAQVLARYHEAFQAHDETVQAAAIRWLRGEYTTKTEARQDLGVRSIIDDNSFYDYLKLVAKFLRIAGYNGLLVCIDELVVLSHRLNNRQARDRNYEAILRIVNDCLQGSVEGLGFVFAATDDALEDRRRGIFSYEALATRLAANRFAKDGLIDLSGPVLKLTSLTPEDCFVLLHNIRRVHERADDSKRRLPDEGIEAYLSECHHRMGSQYFLTPRETIKDFVGLLNVLEQSPNRSWRDLLATMPTTAPTAEDTAEPDEDDDSVGSPRTKPTSSAAGSVGGSERARAPGGTADGAGVSSGPDDDLSSFRL